jgi:ferredoxin-nitrite reductase
VFCLSAQSLDQKVQNLQPPTSSRSPIADACPGLFYPTFAKDGRLIRIRTPGGKLSSQQARVLAALGNLYDKPLQVTNRANLQIRGLPAAIPPQVLIQLQDAGLAARLSAVDHLRNIMASPTAGIDKVQLIDTTPWVSELDSYFSSHGELAELSAKFSVGFDGGEQVAIAHHNDILLKAIDSTHFCLYLVSIPVGVIEAEQCVKAIAAIAKVYLEASQNYDGDRKLRLKQLVQMIGVQELCDRAHLSHFCQFHLNEPSIPRSEAFLHNLTSRTLPEKTDTQSPHIGIHSQQQSHLSYVGVTLPLGRLEPLQLEGLADLVDEWCDPCSNGEFDRSLRLTPWQNLLIPNIPNAVLPQVLQRLKTLDLYCSPLNIYSGLIACAGSTCASSATDAQLHALQLADYLDHNIAIDVPITIHFSGCSKSCAYHGASDLTLVGTWVEQRSAYQLYVGKRDSPFGRELATIVPEHLSFTLLQMLQRYQQHRTSADQSFCAFVDRHPIAQLQQWFDLSLTEPQEQAK